MKPFNFSKYILNNPLLNEEVESPEKAVDKVMPIAAKIQNSPELDAVAEKIAADPNLVVQLEKALQKGGVSVDLNESLDTNDMKTLALNFAKKTQQVQERISNDPDADTSSAGLSMGSAVVGGTIGGMAKGLILSAVPAAASMFAGPALVGAAMGIALFLIARKVYLKMNPDL